MSKECDMACDILSLTHDGDDLSPKDLRLVELAVNQALSVAGKIAFNRLHQTVTQDQYQKPWFHGIKHLTINHEGFVYWKGVLVEHYTPHWQYSAEAKMEAEELARRCHHIESTGNEVSMTSVIWEWEEQYGNI